MPRLNRLLLLALPLADGAAQAAGASAGYALGQSLAEARQVVPAGRTARSWALRCTGDTLIPPGLKLTLAERRTGLVRCWPMIATPQGEQRAAAPRTADSSAREELEFLNDRIVRITITVADRRAESGRTILYREADARAAGIDALR